jgi:hypothetical protein
MVGDSATANRSVVQGTVRGNAWTFYIDEPEPRGMAIFFSALDAAMTWLRETVHGVQPTVVRFDLTARADSITGTRTVTGFGAGRGTTAAVTGRRIAPRP